MSVASDGAATSTLESIVAVEGPWSLATSRRFWEGFAPSALVEQAGESLRTVFLSDTDWTRIDAVITQEGGSARISVTGTGDLDVATEQVRRFMSIDIDGRGWTAVAERDPVIADAQRRLPGFRPCGFFSPYEAAVWAVLSQRIQMRQAAGIKKRLTDEHGDDGAFPAPAVLRKLELSLPGRKNEYLHAVADAALEGALSGEHLRSLTAHDALQNVQEIKGLGPFAAELVVIRGANFADVLPVNEKRLDTEIVEQYGTEKSIDEITAEWAPYRARAGVHLRALREERTGEIAGRR